MWVLAGVWLALNLTFAYVFNYIAYTTGSGNFGTGEATDTDGCEAGALPAVVVILCLDRRAVARGRANEVLVTLGKTLRQWLVARLIASLVGILFALWGGEMMIDAWDYEIAGAPPGPVPKVSLDGGGGHSIVQGRSARVAPMDPQPRAFDRREPAPRAEPQPWFARIGPLRAHAHVPIEGLAGLVAERAGPRSSALAHHDRRSAAEPAQHVGERVDLLRGEGDDG